MMEQMGFLQGGFGDGAFAPSPRSPMALRPYQRDARDAIRREWDELGRLRTLLVLPTGTGKTIVFSAVVCDEVAAGRRVLILAHRAELLEQAADKLQRSTGLRCAVEKAESSCRASFYRVVVGSVQTLCQPKRLASFPEDYFDTIIIDEAHHCLSESYRRILDHFKGARVLGVTATPDRGDMRDLGAVFESLAYEYTLPKAIREGYLCPIRAMTIPLRLDISGVTMSGGDYAAGSLGSALDPYLGGIAREMVRQCAGRRTVVFLPLIATSQKMCEILNGCGLRAAEINGNSEDRKDILQRFERGELDVLCNSMLLTEGWDCPGVDCIVVLRPTKVRSLYCQMVGRGTRLAPGKDHLLLLDFLWMTERHELCRPACLIASGEDVAARMTRDLEELAKESGAVAVDIEQAAKEAGESVVAEREAALAKQLEEMKRRRRKLVDPLQFEMSIQDHDLSGYMPSFGFEAEPPTDLQKRQLEHLGIFPDEIGSKGKASMLLNRLAQRRDDGLTTPKQIRCLERYGFEHVGTWQFSEAKRLIDRIAGNGWRVPPGLNPRAYKPQGASGPAFSANGARDMAMTIETGSRQTAMQF